MKFISWNCCLPPWSFTRNQRLPLIVSTLLKEKPDLICLQEVFSKNDAQHLIEQFAGKGLEHSFKYQDLLIISKEPFFFSYEAKFKDQGKTFSLSLLDVLYGKAFQAVGVQGENLKIFLINTHLLSAYALSGEKYQNTRTGQAREVCTYLQEVADKDIILAGDFNFEPETEPYKIIKEFGFIDLSCQILRTTKRKKFDYVFAKNLSLDIIQISNKFTDLSNHAFLILDLKIPVATKGFL